MLEFCVSKYPVPLFVVVPVIVIVSKYKLAFPDCTKLAIVNPDSLLDELAPVNVNVPFTDTSPGVAVPTVVIVKFN
jgi:hypothetical protein